MEIHAGGRKPAQKSSIPTPKSQRPIEAPSGLGEAWGSPPPSWWHVVCFRVWNAARTEPVNNPQTTFPCGWSVQILTNRRCWAPDLMRTCRSYTSCPSSTSAEPMTPCGKLFLYFQAWLLIVLRFGGAPRANYFLRVLRLASAGYAVC